MWKICTLTILFALTSNVVLDAQDVRFSQYFVLPNWLNPALSGNYDGTYRLSSLYRSQWNAPLDKPITSFGFGADTKFSLTKNKQNSDKISAGLFLMNDRSNVNDFNTNHISLAMAYHKLLDQNTEQYISGGLLWGISQLGLGYQDATFGDQFNGLDGYTRSTSEIFPPNSQAFMELGLGAVYRIKPRETTTYYVGLSAFHLTGPNISFFNLVEDVNVSFETESNLSRRISAYFAAAIDVGKTAKIYPRILYTAQSPVSELNAGLSYRQMFYTTRRSALHLGAYFSIADHLGSTHFNSFTALVGFEMSELTIGFSYEQAIDDLSSYAGFGGFEISFSYIGNLDNQGEFCPSF